MTVIIENDDKTSMDRMQLKGEGSQRSKNSLQPTYWAEVDTITNQILTSGVFVN